MSWKVQALVGERVCGSITRKMVLLNMAARANDDGTGVYAAIPTIAGWCEIDARSVRRVVRELEEEGLIRLVGSRPCKTGAINDWEMVIDALSALPLVKDEVQKAREIRAEQRARADTVSARTECPPGLVVTPDTVSARTESPQTPDTVSARIYPGNTTSQVSSKPSKARSPASKPEKRPIPPDWRPSEPLLEFAARYGYSPHEARFIAQKFVLHFEGTGERRPGWDASFKTWVTRENPRQVKAAAAQWRDSVADSAELERRRMLWEFDGTWSADWGPRPSEANENETGVAA